MKRVITLSAAIAAITASAAASPPSKLVLTANGQIVPRGAEVGGLVEIGGVCGRNAISGMLKANRRPVDRVRVRKTSPRVACEGGPVVNAKISSAQATTAGDLIVLGRVGYTTGSIEPKHCAWEISELRGHFAIPGPLQTGLSGIGTLDSAHSDAGCAPHEEFTGEVRLTEAKTDAVLDAEA